MNTSTENKIEAYIDAQLKEKRDKALREMVQGIDKQIDRGPEYVIETGVEPGGVLTMTARKK